MDNRSTILDRALALFAARGYDAIGVQEIVDAAGVTKPTLYHYFGSKRGVLETLVRERFAPLTERLAQLALVNSDVPETLRRVARIVFEFARQEPALYRLRLSMMVVVPENEAFQIMATAAAAQRRLLEQVFEAFAEYNGNMRGRQHIYATTFLGVLDTYVTLALNGELALDEASVQRAVQQFVFGIYS